MADVPIRILLVDGDPLAAERTRAALADGGVGFAVERVGTRAGFEAAVGRPWDLILSGLEVPGLGGAEALAIARARVAATPFVVVTGAAGEAAAVELLRAGATDYVLRERLAQLPGVAVRAVREARDRAERARAERARAERGLRQSEDRYRFLAEAVPQIVWTSRADGTLDYLNGQWYRYTGQPPGVVPADDGWSAVHPDDVAAARAAWRAGVASGEPIEVEQRVRRGDGAYRWHLTRAVPRRDPATGAVVQWVGTATDVHDRRAAEAALARTASLYRTLTEAVPGVVFTNRPDGSLEYVNPAWTAYTGQSLAQARAGWADVVHPDDRDRVARWWAACVATGTLQEIEYRVRTAGGTDRWLLVRSAPVRDDGGRVSQWVGVAIDIDARRRAEERAGRLVAQMDAILGNMNEGLVVADAAGRMLSINAAAQRLYDLPSPDQFPRHVRDLPARFELTAPDGTPVPAEDWPMARVLRGQTYADYEVRLRLRSSTRPWVASYAGTAVRGVDGRIELAVVTFRDVTAQRRAGAELAAAKAAADAAREGAELANRAKDEFLATLSHELRTPLNAILGWTQLLLADPGAGAEDLRDTLRTVERNAQVQRQLIEDLLDTSRIISGKLRLTFAPTDLRGVLAAAADSVRPAANARGVRVVVDPGPAAGARPGGTDPAAVTVTADAARLQQVAWNLLANAIKFTPRGGTVTAQVRADPAAGTVELAVADTGQGIAAAFLPRVFDRFRQADGSAARQHGGLGLGLAIVRHLVELHGGHVRAESDGPGRGATFYVTLPIATAADARPPDGGGGDDASDADWVPALQLPRDTAAAAAAVPPVASLAGVRAVVVDDEPDARSLVAAVLRRHGADVVDAGSAADAAVAVARVRPDVLVSDIGMPGEDGYALLARVRALPDGPGRTPAVAVTAYAHPADRSRALAAGFAAHLSKPVRADDLVAAVAAALGRPPPGGDAEGGYVI